MSDPMRLILSAEEFATTFQDKVDSVHSSDTPLYDTSYRSTPTLEDEERTTVTMRTR